MRRGGTALRAAASRWVVVPCHPLRTSPAMVGRWVHTNPSVPRPSADVPIRRPFPMLWFTQRAGTTRFSTCRHLPILPSQSRWYARRGAREDNKEAASSRQNDELDKLDDLDARWEREMERLEELHEQDENDAEEQEDIPDEPGVTLAIDASDFEFDSDGLAYGRIEAGSSYYIGQFNKEGKPHGMGRLAYSDGVSYYTGEWSHGHWDGWGKLVQATGDVLEGEWDYGKLSGEGRLTQADGSVFDGQWLDNRPCGEGRYVWPDGTVFEGVWGLESDFEDSPEQTVASPDSAKRSEIAGDSPDNAETYREMTGPGKMVGIGIIRFANRSVYDGEWRNLRPHGFGKLIFEDGAVYKGDFENGQFHGVGRLKFANKGEYEGEWRNGRRQGRGRMINPDGKVEVGHWKRDRLVQPDQDEEQYMDHTKSFLMGDRYTPRTMDAEVVGPAEPRGTWAGRFSGKKKPTEVFGDADLEDEDEDEEDVLPRQGGRYDRVGEGLAQGKYKSTSYNKWQPLNERGRN